MSLVTYLIWTGLRRHDDSVIRADDREC